MSWSEQLKQQMNSESLISNKNKIDRKVQVTSFIDHKCNFCKKLIPSGNGLIRITERIYIPNQEQPFFKSKYYHNEDCEMGKVIREEYEATGTKNHISSLSRPEIKIPEGYEIIT